MSRPHSGFKTDTCKRLSYLLVKNSIRQIGVGRLKYSHATKFLAPHPTQNPVSATDFDPIDMP